MSIWSDLFSKNEDLANTPDVNKEPSIVPSEKEVRESSIINYDQFVKQPGKSVSFLNNDPNWNRFVEYETDHEEELVARFKRKEFENHFLESAYKKGIISFRTIENRGIYEIKINVNEIITTYLRWANKNEPILCINAMILNTTVKPGLNRCVFNYSYLVRAPFAGYLDSSSFWQERETNGGRLYKLYTAQRAKELWPHFEQYGYIFDDPDRLDHVDVRFNEYIYDEKFWEGIPHYDFEAEDDSPCLRYEWKVSNYSQVVKDQHICTIIKNPNRYNRKEYKIYSPASGIITLSLNGKTSDYKCREEIDNCNELFLFSVYKNRASLMRHHFYFFDCQERDEFDGTISVSWETGRRLPKSEEDESYLDDYPGLEMKADSGKYIIVSLELKNNIPYIVFSVDSKLIRLNNGDSIDMQFVGIDGDKTVLNFPITRNHIEKKVSNVYDNCFYCELSQDDISCMMNNDCVSWRVRFSKQPFMSVVGSNESIWCPKEYAGDVFRSYSSQFMELIEELRNEYTISFSSNSNSKPTIAINETCFVYLMVDTTNGYFKIGISNDPEYREHTLQSEKPTIEKLCAKEYPNRTIASAIESALHKAYESKRLRGEWFALDADDVNAIIATLS